jgi:predicted Zn-dependent protease
MKSLSIAVLLFIALAFAPAAAVASYTYGMGGKADTARLKWKEPVIRIAVSNSLVQPNSNIKANSDVWGAFRRGIETWQAVAGVRFEFELTDGQSVSPSGTAGDEISLITISQTAENVMLFSKNPFAESAKTRVFFNSKGHITEADIVLNPFQQFSTDGTYGTYDLEATITHELGHLLGLRHSEVLGAVMAEGLTRNGAMSTVERTAKPLSETDIAAIRDLYGPANPDDMCCATVTGQLVAGGRFSRQAIVWAEENGTGRVQGQTVTSSDGSFRLGGLPTGTYSVFWQVANELLVTPIGELGTFKLGNGETKVVNGRFGLKKAELALSLIGSRDRLAGAALQVMPGQEHHVNLAGANLSTRPVKIEFNSPFFRVLDNSIAVADFGSDISAISFVVSVDKGTPQGTYSIFATGEDGSVSSLIGAIRVQ